MRRFPRKVGTSTTLLASVIGVLVAGSAAFYFVALLPKPSDGAKAASTSASVQSEQPVSSTSHTQQTNPTNASSSVAANQNSTSPCGIVPGVSVVTSNGKPTCVAGPALVVNPDGRVDFRNGTIVDLHTNLTGVGTLGDGSGKNVTVILPGGTRITFDSRGIIVTIFPYQGRVVYSNGTIVRFVAYQFPIDPDLQLPHGLAGNGTAWWTSSNGIRVSFYPNGTCSEA
jgi:hypothetical protein